MENEEKVTTEPTMQEEQVDNTAINEQQVVTENADTTSKSFTQEQVNDIVRARLERSQARLFNRYGVGDRKGLDELIGKAQAYQVMNERYNGLKNENSNLKQELAFMSNNINPTRKEDIIAHFKGKGMEFSNDNLVSELATHPEWLNPTQKDDVAKTTIRVLGNSVENERQRVNEKDEIAKLLGYSRLI